MKTPLLSRFRHKPKPPKPKQPKVALNKWKKEEKRVVPNTHTHHVRHPFSSDHSSRNAARKLKRLQRDGIIILIDQPNLEHGMEKRMSKKHIRWTVSYKELINIIASRGDLKKDPRRVLKTYLVTSKKFQKKTSFRPSSKYMKRHRITVKKSPYRKTYKEKAVDCMLVRIMTQEFEGIEVLRLMGIEPADRTFCLVAGDFDYVDVVRQARESGCDVEIWYWKDKKEMSSLWKEQLSRNGCRSKRCGRLVIKDLGKFLDTLSRWKEHGSEKHSRKKSDMDSYAYYAWSEPPFTSD